MLAAVIAMYWYDYGAFAQYLVMVTDKELLTQGVGTNELCASKGSRSHALDSGKPCGRIGRLCSLGGCQLPSRREQLEHFRGRWLSSRCAPLLGEQRGNYVLIVLHK